MAVIEHQRISMDTMQFHNGYKKRKTTQYVHILENR